MPVSTRALHRISRGAPAPPGSYEAVVTKAAVPGEPLVLTIEETADEGSLELVAHNWIKKPAGAPAVGDRALVEIDAAGRPWVIAWAGQGA